jgi:hypothetical protein
MRVERRRIGVSGDGVDQFDDLADAGRGLGQLADAIFGLFRLRHGLAGDARGVLHMAAGFVDRGRHLSGGGGDGLHIGGGFLRHRRTTIDPLS